MPFDKRWKLRSLGLGALWGLLYTLILLPSLSVDTPLKEFEVQRKEQLSKVPEPRQTGLRSDAVNQILLVTIDNQEVIGSPKSFSRFRKLEDYTNLIKNLIDLGAQVVLINLPSEVLDSPEPLTPIESGLSGDSIRSLVENYSNRIVLSSPPELKRSGPFFRVYNQFLPINSRTLEPIFPPETIQGFSEFSTPVAKDGLAASLQIKTSQQQLIRQPLLTLLKAYSINPVRYPYAVENSFNSGMSDTNTSKNAKGGPVNAFQSAVCLAANKLNPSNVCSNSPLPSYSDPHVSFSMWEADFSKSLGQEFCGAKIIDPVQQVTGCDRASRRDFSSSHIEKVKGKIVIIDFPQNDPNWSELPTSVKAEPLSPAEMQANVLASILSNNIQYPLSQEWSLGLTLAGSMLMAWLLSPGLSKSSFWWLTRGPLIVLGIPLAYAALLPTAFAGRVVLPIMLPILTWVLTGISMTLVLLLKKSREQAAKQRQELTQRNATLSRTRKVLARVATDIHDGPLQELKLVMDQVEELETLIDPELLVVKTSVKSEPIVDKLVRIGQDIRNQLNDLQIIARKQLDISPELVAGLAQGIQTHLKQLEERGDLRLKVKQLIKPLQEPELNPDWIDDREDIFRFFKEAINNVMRHAQQPYGRASWVEVCLEQQGEQCKLAIANDGVYVSGNTSKPPNHLADDLPKGTGTKTMETIAISLDNGRWQRTLSPEGLLRVELFWSLKQGLR
ncbi:CHASE2 domain-containing protein [Thermoleptolyngbya sp. M55_K2018_002]|uniref:CHASE2 domain-containing protein n=1 Tax=Thermoleptolyngbya sp. M55_K2018_002 TaxID=2747808 RepID=UPI0019F0346A|nr:CHASE2 domain-containing protein [Thermoleptolyngbya sp. M55_K2018_002]HIK41285.1 CHASE2 domain-containing protein [Thermoleptolyngbya sp. M55_K2018_002]